jgi:exopolysaccharide biosynthesis polyprenyl glycosylphosphotransferase
VIGPRHSLLSYTPFIAAIDLMTILGCSWIVLAFAAGASGTEYFAAWWHFLPVNAISALLILGAFGLYQSWYRVPLADLEIFISVSVGALAAVWMLLRHWEPNHAIPGSLIVRMALLQGMGLTLERMLIRAIIRRGEMARQTVVVVPDGPGADQVRHELLSSTPPWLPIIRFLTAEDFNRLPDSEIVWHTILLTREIEDKGSIIRRASALGRSVFFIPGVAEILMNGASLLNVDDMLMLGLTPPQLNVGQRLFKRAMDIAGSMFLLTIAAPVMLAVALLIRLTSPGKALFTQKRVGRDGVEFSIHKFRTMVANAERHTGPVLATANDPRITRPGAFLRATRLDEFPQLFNVLRGEMSLVGPRPERPYFVGQFREQVPGYDFRLTVKPGVTGLAQVFGRYSTLSERKLSFDLTYITKYSLLMDTRILLSTIAVLLRRKQAEGIAVNARSSVEEGRTDRTERPLIPHHAER